MNIIDAKNEIKRTFRAYTARDESGRFKIPLDKQRPVLLIGPPGIGKTAIMQQIAEETDCGLLCYTMTHHTRQSAIGLPYIEKRTYDGKTYSVTEYTMSEIVASIYDYIAKSGKRDGILFLDEINCVSETLAPVMLQLLQNKTFGVHALPEGWIIAAAGNPPEYNKSVRDMDMATLDRVKHMEIEADLNVWKEYAQKRNIHPAILGYLSLYPEYFYKIEDTPRGKLFVTARGWEDMSCALEAYEDAGEKIEDEWFLQYIQHDEIAHGFAVYYRLHSFLTTREGNLEDKLLDDKSLLDRFTASECLTVASILFHSIHTMSLDLHKEETKLIRMGEILALLPEKGSIREFVLERENTVNVKARHQSISVEERLIEIEVLRRIEDEQFEFIRSDAECDFSKWLNSKIDKEKAELDLGSISIISKIEKSYKALENCMNGESSLLYFTTDLSADKDLSEVLRKHPIKAFSEYCLKLL